MKMINKKMNKCKKCNHTWEPRKKKSLSCPKCKTYFWEYKT